MFDKVLVANRGEIAVRVMQACEELGIGTVAVYSDADKRGGHVRYADEAYNIGPARASESYLNQEAILEAARKADADAIHPGYGFLAENDEFAERVEESEFTWIGPPSKAMRKLGGKTKARSVMKEAGVPVVPGTTEPVESADEVKDLGDEYGYPIAIKAEGGGGGRGLKVVRSENEVESQFESAKREGEAYFDNPEVYVEKYLEAPRHIEVQVLADQHGNVLHLGERDCSLQRRHQKVIEEAPSPALDADLREEIGEAARRGVREAGYYNAGTVEFLVADDEFYFMEVNTRIQVEHTVTEEITGIDIVKWQIRIAAGEELTVEQDDVEWDGHAVEYRINAENPAKEFSPTPGKITTYDPPSGIGVRLDHAIRQGDEISGDYDSMIAKLIVRAGDRDECLKRSKRALRSFEVEGVHTTIPFHRLMLNDDTFVEGKHTTNYLDNVLDKERIKEAVEEWGPREVGVSDEEEVVEREFVVEVNGKRFEVTLEDHSMPAPAPDRERQRRQSSSRESRSAGSAGESEGQRQAAGTTAVEGGERVEAEMQGTILQINVSEGDEVEEGDVLCVLEAMKMENDILAPSSGTVTRVGVNEGETVNMGDVLFVIE